MRLALGYERGLPHNWPLSGDVYETDLWPNLPLAFPKHRVYVWATTCFYDDIKQVESLEYMGTEIRGDESDKWGNSLFAFSYKVGPDEGHVVIGCPATGNSGLQLFWAIAVKI
jgi:hypothetical protein